MTETPRTRTPNIKPGWFIAGNIHAVGCFHYQQEGRQQTEEGDKIDASWHSRAHCDSVTENKNVYKNKARAVAAIGKVCTATRVGWFCPYDREEELTAALKEVDGIIAQHNAEAQQTKLWSDLLPIEVGASNSLAARVVWQEAKAALVELQAAMKTADLLKMRRAAAKIANLHDVLPSGQDGAMRTIAESVRSLATVLKRDAEKLDRNAKVELLRKVYAPVEVRRMQFAEALEQADKAPTALPQTLRDAERL